MVVKVTQVITEQTIENWKFWVLESSDHNPDTIRFTSEVEGKCSQMFNKYWIALTLLYTHEGYDQRLIKPSLIRAGKINEVEKKKILFAVEFLSTALKRPLIGPWTEKIEHLCADIDRLDHHSRTESRMIEIIRQGSKEYAQKLEHAMIRAFNSGTKVADYFNSQDRALISYFINNSSSGSNSLTKKYYAALLKFGNCMSKEHNRHFAPYLLNPYKIKPYLMLSEINHLPIIVGAICEIEAAYLGVLNIGLSSPHSSTETRSWISNVAKDLNQINADEVKKMNRQSIGEAFLDQVQTVYHMFTGQNSPRNTDRRPQPPKPVRGHTYQQAKHQDHEHRRAVNAWRGRERARNVNFDEDDDNISDSEAEELQPDNDDDNVEEGLPHPDDDDNNNNDEEGLPHDDDDDQEGGEIAENFPEPETQSDIEDRFMNQINDRAVDIINRMRARPEDFVFASHRRRFGNDAGVPYQLSRTEVRDNDLVVSYSNNRNSVRFVITYNGPHDQIVYNRIIDNSRRRWI